MAKGQVTAGPERVHVGGDSFPEIMVQLLFRAGAGLAREVPPLPVEQSVIDTEFLIHVCSLFVFSPFGIRSICSSNFFMILSD